MSDTKSTDPKRAYAGLGGTLGATILPRTGMRVAGLSIPWGASRTLPIGFSTGVVGNDQPVELVRATVGGPTTWAIVAYVNGALAVGDGIRIQAFPGIGTGQTQVTVGVLSSVVPTVFFPSPSGLPANELIVSVSVTVPLVGTGTVSIVACPIAWPHWSRGPQVVNP